MKFLKKYSAYITALVIFLLAGCIYCAPSFEGKIVAAGDTTGNMGIGQDVAAYHAETGKECYWTGTMFSGMPDYQICPHYKSSDYVKPLKKFFLGGWFFHGTYVILITYFISFFILLLAFGINPSLSMAGALAIGFSSYFLTIIPAGHLYKTATIPALAMMIGGMHLIFRKKYVPGALLVLFPMLPCIVIHPQMTYYMFMLAGVLYFAEIYIHIKEKRCKDLAVGTLIFGACVLVSLGANSSNVFVNKEYAEQTMRGGQSDIVKSNDGANKTKGLDIDYATEWSYGIDESLSFLIPGIKGGSSAYPVGKDSKLYDTLVKNRVSKGAAASFCEKVPLYWGEQNFTAGNVYMGAVVCFLFILGLILVKGPYKWALAIATLFSVMLAWGHNCMWLTRLFFDHFPMYCKFRAVSSILIVAEVTMPLLGFMAIKEIVGGSLRKEEVRRAMFWSLGITGGICLVIGLFGGSMFSFRAASDASWASGLPGFVMDGIVAQRRALVISDAWRSLSFIALSFGLLWLYTADRIKSTVALAALLAALVVADLWPVNKRYFNDSNFVNPKKVYEVYDKMPYEEQILQDPDYFRVMNLTVNTFNESRTSKYLNSIGGYSAAKLRRYQDLIDEHITKMNMNVLNMLNTKYFITAGSDGQPVPMLNPDAFGNAWFVDELQIVDDANSESEALRSLDLRHVAVLDKSFASYVKDRNPGPDLEAWVRLTDHAAPILDYEYHCSKPGTIVFSEIYYPYGWKVTIDGEPVDHYRVDYTLRAVNVPSGTHSIHFEFDPDKVRQGETLAMGCIILAYLFVLAAVAVFVHRLVKRRR